ncbi:hypothetical protein [Actinacidiphila acididurans]|uniref:Secreted protein n=1 Tax=Actinacidiphila acididurans TaxID=2784346 RepID=A0ABS2TZX2_9ACTN|nr:hypothetical protein [Actinacidiphila acididurans]MBM9508501.1 hypothetical protein [Actinacidiphila acididurans]
MAIVGVLAMGIAGLAVVAVVAVVLGLIIVAGRRPRRSVTTARWSAYWGDDGRAVVPSAVGAQCLQEAIEQQPGHGAGGHHGHHGHQGHHGHGGHGLEPAGFVGGGGHHDAGGGFHSGHHSGGHHG